MSRLAILLPLDADAPPGWLTVAEGAVTDRGQGDDWPRAAGGTTQAVLLAPAAAVALHRALLPDLAVRQAQAAARLMAVENALGDPATLHVAAGPRDADGGLDVAVVANADMAAWLGWAADRELDPVAVVPAALLLPRPEEGFVRARVGAETIARDKSSAFALDPALAGLVVGDAPVTEVPVAAVEAALVAAVAAPPLDLRQGPFARRQRRGIDRGLVKRAALLTGVILLLALAIALVRIAKLDGDTGRLDARALAEARTVIPELGDVTQAEAALDARAAALGVGGRGFANAAARLFAALEQNPAVALTQFDLGADGTLRATLAAPAAGDLDVAVAAVRGSGAGAVTTPVIAGDGRQSVQVTVSPR